MILTHYLFNSPIVFDESKIQRLVFESPADLGVIVDELRGQIEGFEGRFILSESEKEIDCSRSVELIIDPFSVNLNSKDILAGFYKTVSKELETGKDYLDYREAIGNLLQIVVSVSSEIESSSVLDELSSQLLLKAISLGLSEEADLCERICEYVRLVSTYTGRSLVIIINLPCFISTEQYNDCIRQLSYHQVPILLIESVSRNDRIPTKLFDIDFCEINL